MRLRLPLLIPIWAAIILSAFGSTACTGLRQESVPSACQTKCNEVSRVCTLPKRRLTENDIATHANCVRTQADRCRVKHSACVEAL